MRFNEIKAKTALLRIGKTQTALAESTGLSLRWVGRAFNGGDIGQKAATRIANALGVELDDLKEV